MLSVPLRAEPVLAAGPTDCWPAASKLQNRSKSLFWWPLQKVRAGWWSEQAPTFWSWCAIWPQA